VTAPANASVDAVVRCPLCNEEYPLDEALRSVPPMLIVVAPGPSVDSAGEDLSIRLAPADSPQPFAFDERAAPRKLATRPKPQRREKNAFVEIFKIVAGGVVGLSIGQMILWWIPLRLQPSQRDPGQLAPIVSRYVPWILPQSLRVPEDVPVAKREFAEKRSSRSSERETARHRNETPAQESDSQRLESRREARSESHELETPPDLDPDKLENLPQGLEPIENEVKVVPGVASAPIIPADEVRAALTAAQTSWNESSSSEELGQLCRALRRLARNMTFANASDKEIQTVAASARTLLRDIGSNSEQLEKLLATPEPLIGHEKYPGRFVSGTLEKIEMAGRMFSSTLHTVDGDVDVISVVDPRRSMEEGDRVLILGVEIQRPKQQLLGFEGDSAPVIFGGLVAKCPKASPAITAQPSEKDGGPPAPPREGDTQSTLEEEASRGAAPR
jgi:hypothetical protein